MLQVSYRRHSRGILTTLVPHQTITTDRSSQGTVARMSPTGREGDEAVVFLERCLGSASETRTLVFADTLTASWWVDMHQRGHLQVVGSYQTLVLCFDAGHLPPVCVAL